MTPRLSWSVEWQLCVSNSCKSLSIKTNNDLQNRRLINLLTESALLDKPRHKMVTVGSLLPVSDCCLRVSNVLLSRSSIYIFFKLLLFKDLDCISPRIPIESDKNRIRTPLELNKNHIRISALDSTIPNPDMSTHSRSHPTSLKQLIPSQYRRQFTSSVSVANKGWQK